MTIRIDDYCAGPMQIRLRCSQTSPKKIRSIRKRGGQWYHSKQKNWPDARPKQATVLCSFKVQLLYTPMTLSPSPILPPWVPPW